MIFHKEIMMLIFLRLKILILAMLQFILATAEGIFKFLKKDLQCNKHILTPPCHFDAGIRAFVLYMAS